MLQGKLYREKCLYSGRYVLPVLGQCWKGKVPVANGMYFLCRDSAGMEVVLGAVPGVRYGYICLSSVGTVLHWSKCL